jgi:hypothetical protein
LVCFLLISNTVIDYVRDNVLDTTPFVAHRFCLLFCAESRLLTLSFAITITIFCLRFLYLLIRFPGRCSLLRTKISYTVNKEPSEPTDAQSTTELVTKS